MASTATASLPTITGDTFAVRAFLLGHPTSGTSDRGVFFRVELHVPGVGAGTFYLDKLDDVPQSVLAAASSGKPVPVTAFLRLYSGRKGFGIGLQSVQADEDSNGSKS